MTHSLTAPTTPTADKLMLTGIDIYIRPGPVLLAVNERFTVKCAAAAAAAGRGDKSLMGVKERELNNVLEKANSRRRNQPWSRPASQLCLQFTSTVVVVSFEKTSTAVVSPEDCADKVSIVSCGCIRTVLVAALFCYLHFFPHPASQHGS